MNQRRKNAAMILWTLIVIGPLWTVTATETEALLKSSFGDVTGLVNDAVSLGNVVKSGNKFLGIPYAKPPTGEKRFQKPEPEVHLNKSYNATYFRPACPQSRMNNQLIAYFRTDEDCLYLNVFVPGGTVSSDSNLPVMIWIYGGGFMTGLADIYFGDVLSSFNDVVVVTFNYRVNVFGFLDDGTGTFANNGLQDQKVAIDWVHRHIRSFGGDPSKITIFGESAGSASVIYQALNPGNMGKMQRVVAQSGSPLASWAFEPRPNDIYYNYATKLNCTKHMNGNALACLKSKSLDELINAIDANDSFKPTVDGEFLTTDPDSLFANYSLETSESLRAFSKVDFVSGFNSKDGGNIVIVYWSALLQNSGINIADGVPRRYFESVYVPATMKNIFGRKSTDALIKATIHEYTDWYDPQDIVKVRDAMIDLSTDINFLVPAVVIAKKHAAMTTANKTFMYRFSHRPILLPPAWLQDGALHAWEIAFVFGLTSHLFIGSGIPPGTPIAFPETTVRLSSDVMKLWTNFAKTGNPSSPTSPGLPEWPSYDTTTQAFIDLTSNLTLDSIQHRPAARKVDFWTNVAPALYNTSTCVVVTCQDCETSSGQRLVINGTNLFVFVVTYIYMLS